MSGKFEKDVLKARALERGLPHARVCVAPRFVASEAELRRLNDEIQHQRLRVFKATMRTVQEIVNNLLQTLQLVHLEAEAELPSRC